MNVQEYPSSDRSPNMPGCHDDGDRFLDFSLDDLERYLLAPQADSWSLRNWEQLRDFAVGGMQSRALSDETRLRWGHVALSAISRKGAGQTPQQTTAESTHVRVYMIQEFGVSDADTYRNLHALCTETLRNLGLPREMVARLADGWKTAPRDQMLQLRRIKNMLTPLLSIRALLENDAPVFQETQAWLDLIPRLP
ncbi:hypothetical protein [Streptomyces sp. NPDC017868]|uniref:hypothetical protein n=1 Tax=Streptomyces sp. NPDC017868 TaxID=3365014 RepID=UPI00378C5F10